MKRSAGQGRVASANAGGARKRGQSAAANGRGTTKAGAKSKMPASGRAAAGRSSVSALKRKMLDAYDAARQSEEGDEDVDLASEDDDDEDNMRRLAEHGLPVKSAADFDDEEIDEDTAFTAEDEERYGSLFRGMSKRKRTTGDEEEEDEEDEGAGGELSHLFEAGDDSEEEDEEGDMDDEDDGEEQLDESEEDDDERLERLVNFVDRLADKSSRKKARFQETTEAAVESEHNVASYDKLSFRDLLESAGKLEGLASVKQQAALLDKLPEAISAPLPRRLQEREERARAYDKTKEALGRWQSFVKRHQQAEHLQFPLGATNKAPVVTTHTLAASVRPQDEMEQEIQQILQAAGLSNEKKAADIEFGQLQQLTPLEQEQRQAELARLRSLMFAHELKAKRTAKIKSKTYHRILKRERIRKELGMDELSELDPEAAKAKSEKAEMDRIKERMSLRHKTTSRWSRHASVHATKKSALRDALSEQHRIGKKLTERTDRPSVLEARDDSSDHGDEQHGGAGEPAVVPAAPAPARRPQRAPIVPKTFAVLPDETTLDPTAAAPTTRKGIVLTQRDLVARAFEADNVLERDFLEQKAGEVAEGLPQLENHTVPGWGSWGGAGAAPPRGPSERAQREHAAARKKAADARADAKLKHVIINEKRNVKAAAKYSVSRVPFPFQSREQYERSLQMPAGKDWNTVESFQRATKPRVLTKAGTIIRPPSKPTQA